LHGLTGGGASVPGASRTQSPAAGALDLLHGLDSAAQRQGAYIAYLRLHLRRRPPVLPAAAVNVIRRPAPPTQNEIICERSRQWMTRWPSAPSRRSACLRALS